MNKPIMRPVKPEEDVEEAVANALQGLKVEEPGQPMAYPEDRHRESDSALPRFVQEPSGPASGACRQRQRQDHRVDQGA